MCNRRLHVFFHLYKYIFLPVLFFVIIIGVGCDYWEADKSPWPDEVIEPRFQDMEDGTVQDLETGLIWLKDANAFGAVSWDDAMDEAAALSDGDHGLTDESVDGDWRLPTAEEWEAFVDGSYYRPPVSNSQRNRQWSEGDPFTGIQTEAPPGSNNNGAFYWSSSDRLDGVCVDCVLAIYFGGYGSVLTGDHIEGSIQYVWPVSGVEDEE